MNQNTSNLVTQCLAVISIIIASFALYLSWSQQSADYGRSVVVQPGTLPITRINEGRNEIYLEIVNTSKSNLQYFLRASTNIGCLSGANGRPIVYPCAYESQIIGLSKSDAGKSSYKHMLALDAQYAPVKENPLSFTSTGDYFFTIEIIDASNGHLLFKSECFYGYQLEAKSFALDQPVLDTSGESDKRQRQCRP